MTTPRTCGCPGNLNHERASKRVRLSHTCQFFYKIEPKAYIMYKTSQSEVRHVSTLETVTRICASSSLSPVGTGIDIRNGERRERRRRSRRHGDGNGSQY